MVTDPALVFFDDAHDDNLPGTHVIIIGVGRYTFGKGAKASPVAGDLPQLTSPPASARAVSDWFINEFRNSRKPLVSVSMLVSDGQTFCYSPARPQGAASIVPPEATLDNVKAAARGWTQRLNSHKDNLAVFYFCGHGASLGQQAALLLSDFGSPDAYYEAAVDVTILQGSMRNCAAIEQIFLLDCCRTNADDWYNNEPALGTRIVNAEPRTGEPPQQCILFPTLVGEEAFGIKGAVSVFTNSFIDAVRFAAADAATGRWLTTTSKILDAIDRLVRFRVPAALRNRSKPNAVEATNFEFNEIDEPKTARSFVTLLDPVLWGRVEVQCIDPSGRLPAMKQHSRMVQDELCCTFDLDDGSRWRIGGVVDNPPPHIKPDERMIRLPVAYVQLEIEP